MIVNYSYLLLFNCSTDGCLVLLNRSRRTRREYHLPLHFICHVSRICYACLHLKERLNLHFSSSINDLSCRFFFLSFFLYRKNKALCWWDVISNADVFHTRSMHSLCLYIYMYVFFARLVH